MINIKRILFILKAIDKNGLNIRFVPHYDKKMIIRALKTSYKMLRIFTKNFKRYLIFIVNISKDNLYLLNFLPEKILKNRKFLMKNDAFWWKIIIWWFYR